MGRSDQDNAEQHNAELTERAEDTVAVLLESFDRGYRLGLRQAIDYVGAVAGTELAERMRAVFAAALAQEPAQ